MVPNTLQSSTVLCSLTGGQLLHLLQASCMCCPQLLLLQLLSDICILQEASW